MTNGWIDIKNTDMMLIMGGNPAENHPCGFKWPIEAKRQRNAKMIVVDPRFTRTAATADLFVQIRAGSDIAFLGGLIQLRHRERPHRARIPARTTPMRRSSFRKDSSSPKTASSPASTPAAHAYDKLHRGTTRARAQKAAGDLPAGRLRSDARASALASSSCSSSITRATRRRWSSASPASPRTQFLKAADLFTSIRKDGDMKKAGTIIYAVGWTQHTSGTQIIRTAAMLQLLLGNVGRAGGGVNALRGHSNIQGATDMAGVFDILPGYLKDADARRHGFQGVPGAHHADSRPSPARGTRSTTGRTRRNSPSRS